MPAADAVPLVLFSGLAADAGVFQQQRAAFPQLIVPDWPPPKSNETLDAYSQRLAADLRHLGPAVIGGASFGGIVALHVAQYLETLGIVLIGSVRSPEELPRYARIARPIRNVLPFLPIRLLQATARLITSQPVRRMQPHLSSLVDQFRSSDPAVFRWSLVQLLAWHTPPRICCPVYHVHGACDRTLPASYTHPDLLIPGGGHVISITKATQVNEFIKMVLNQCAP